MEANLEIKKYRLFLYLLKIIPMLVAGISLANTILSIVGIDLVILSYIGCVSFLTLAFIYFASYVFRFCEYHRMFLHYVVVNNVINTLDYYFYFNVSARTLICFNIVLAGIFLFIILKLKLKHDRHIKKSTF